MVKTIELAEDGEESHKTVKSIASFYPNQYGAINQDADKVQNQQKKVTHPHLRRRRDNAADESDNVDFQNVNAVAADPASQMTVGGCNCISYPLTANVPNYFYILGVERQYAVMQYNNNPFLHQYRLISSIV